MGERGRELRPACGVDVGGAHECEGYRGSRPSSGVISRGSLAYSELVPSLHLAPCRTLPALPLATVFTSQLRPQLPVS